MRRFGKLVGFFVVFIAVIAAFCNVSFAATIGQSLTSPEAGWQRIDDDVSSIVYSGKWTRNTNLANSYNHTQHYFNSAYDGTNNSVSFKFYGTKIRILANINNSCTRKATIAIDGVSADYNSYSSVPYTSGSIWCALVFEKTGLTLGTHYITISTDGTNKGDGGNNTLGIDAIDIDDTGYIIAPNQPVNLLATAGNAKVDLKWDAVLSATSYNIKRSLTPSGPYETLATTSSITYTDTNVANGTTYYYVVTAVVSGEESTPSNEASATPTAPEVIGNPGILEITMTNGQIKEYDLSGAELLAFLNWYDGKSDGTGKAYYTITKKNNIKPFLSRKEYIAFDKISSFEVKEYTE